MPNVRKLQRSFAGGEMSPEMLGRIDDAKYQSGLALCRNFITKPQGPAQNRAGFAFVRAVKTSAARTRLLPFTYSTTQTMVIELGAGYIRFHTQGATLMSGGVPYEIANPYAEADLFDIHYVQSADVLTLVHPGYAPRELRRLGATSWTLTTIAFTPTLAAPTGVTATVSGHTSPGKLTYTYVVTAIAADLISESVASAAATSALGNLLETGGICTVAWSAVAGASRYHVYKLQGGIYGYIGQTEGTSIVDTNIAPDMAVCPPTYDTVFNTAGAYPAAVSYFEQRRCFAGTTTEPQKIWMTRSGTEADMSYSLPIKDDDRIAFRVAAREANTIRHIVPLSELLLLTSATEWRVTSVNSDAITPTTISVRPQAYIGASNVQPVIINNTLVYAASRGGHVRELGYNWQANGFMTGDLSMRAAHLFDNLSIVDLAYSKAPQPIVWMVSSNGTLLGLTYVPEQSVGAWHHHDTAGVFESCAVVAEGLEDVLYVVVQRTINGSSVRYVERLQTRLFVQPRDGFFVDAGATYTGTNTTATTMTVTGGSTWGPADTLTVTASAATFTFPAQTDVGDEIVLTAADQTQYHLRLTATSSSTVASGRVDQVLPVSLRAVATTSWAWGRDTIAGLTHLEGATVNVLADGAVHPRRVVTAGAISLERPAVVVHVGLPITADLQTLPVALQIDEGYGQGRYKNVNKIWLRVSESSGIFVGPDSAQLVEAKQRTTEPYGAPPALKTEELLILPTPTWADSGHVFIRQTDPLPLTVVGVTIELALGA